MSGLSSRSSQRKEPGWTQAPSNATTEPVWRDAGTDAGGYQPSQVQSAAPRKSSSGKGWISAVLGVIGLLAVAWLLLSMFNVVEKQMARNDPNQAQHENTGPSLTRTGVPVQAVPVVNPVSR
ncbi:MAG: hypothetical protein LBJ15_24135 [Comamonas sp.]|jgi:hypothetical protein|uniref:hypothetical protein n=1 Tax=Comamonas sp. TaxID=34028 RepID=UPI00281EBD61|nr:hypothetical protein [Comamonas sp.]MDR0217077.1 hypothetical protein [Comamonas sp.]